MRLHPRVRGRRLSGMLALLAAFACPAPGRQLASAGATFAVDVRDEDGQTFPGQWLVLVDLEHESAPGRPFVLEHAQLSPEGRARFPLEALRPAREDSLRLGREPRIVARLGTSFLGAPEVRVSPALEPDAVLSLSIPRAVAWVWRPLQVRVLDSDGRPAAGVPIHGHVRAREGGRELGSGGGVLTDAEGRATVLPRTYEFEPLEAQVSGLVAELPFPEPLWLPWEPGSLEPVTLRLPRSAALTVELRAEPAGPLDVRSMHLRTSAGNGAALQGGMGGAVVEGGRARFPWVARDRALLLSLWREDTRQELEFPLDPIPPDATSAERTVVVPIAPRVRWRLVAPGEDASSVSATLTCLDAQGRRCPRTVDPGRVWREPDGACSIPVDGSLHDGHRRELQLRFPGPAGIGMLARTVPVQWTRALEPGEVLDLGEVVLDEVPELVAGHVHDPDGKPLSGVHLSAYPDVREGPSGERGGPWTAYSDAAGRFTLRGQSAAPSLMLRASLGNVQRELRDVVPGRRDVEVVLPVLATLEVRLLADEGLPRKDLRLRYEGPAGAGWLFWNGWPPSHLVPGERRTPPRHDFLARLAVGTYDLELIDGRSFLPLARWDDVTLEADPEPRLLDLDVRGAIRILRLRLLRPPGVPVQEMVRTGRGDLVFGLFPDEQGQLELLAPTVPCTLVLELEGHEPLHHVLGVDPEERTFVPVPPGR